MFDQKSQHEDAIQFSSIIGRREPVRCKWRPISPLCLDVMAIYQPDMNPTLISLPAEPSKTVIVDAKSVFPQHQYIDRFPMLSLH